LEYILVEPDGTGRSVPCLINADMDSALYERIYHADFAARLVSDFDWVPKHADKIAYMSIDERNRSLFTPNDKKHELETLLYECESSGLKLHVESYRVESSKYHVYRVVLDAGASAITRCWGTSMRMALMYALEEHQVRKNVTSMYQNMHKKLE